MYFKSVSFMFHRCFMCFFIGISCVFHLCFEGVSRVVQRCFKCVSRQFDWCYESIFRGVKKAYQVLSQCFVLLFIGNSWLFHHVKGERRCHSV